MPNVFGFDDEDETTPDPADPFADSPVVTNEEPDPGEEESPLLQPTPTVRSAQEEAAAPDNILAPAGDGQPTGDAAGGEGAAPAGDGAPAPWTSRWVGEGRKYTDQAALEQGLDNALEMSQRAAERAAQAEEHAQQLQAYLSQAAAQLQAPAATPPGPDLQAVADRIRAFATEQGWDDNQTRSFAQIVASVAEAQTAPVMARAQAVEAQIAQERARAANDGMARAAEAQRLGEIATWRAAHAAELGQDGALEERVGQAFLALDVWEDDPLPMTRRTLDIAAEAATDPALMQVLQAMPDFIQTDHGMALARQLAGGATPAVTAAAAPATPGRAAPHVEQGGSGLRPTAADPDEWAVLTLARKERTTSPLGI